MREKRQRRRPAPVWIEPVHPVVQPVMRPVVRPVIHPVVHLGVRPVVCPPVYLAVCLAVCLLACLLSGCQLQKPDTKKAHPSPSAGSEAEADEKETDKTAWEQAAHSPYAPYPDTVTYTLAKTAVGDGNLPVGDTFADNAYTRYLEENLHIKSEIVLAMEQGEGYNEALKLLVDDNQMPDVAVVQGKSTVEALAKRGLLADLTGAYEECTTDRIKEIYASYGPELLDNVRIDGRLYAFPDTVIDHGPDLLWLRRDWMKKLHLDAPRSMEEAMEIVRTFVNRKAGGEGTIGLALSPRLFTAESERYGSDVLFDMYGERGALAYMQALYQNGTIDPRFLLRKDENIDELIQMGKCGAIFGKWWAPNNPLSLSRSADPSADWQPYLFCPSDAGQEEMDETRLYVVASRRFTHPELIAKNLSLLFDRGRYEDRQAQDLNDYFSMNVDPTARPFSINVDYVDALYRTTDHIRQAMDGTLDPTKLTGLEMAYYRTCRSYMNGQLTTAAGWAAYTSRITAIDTLRFGGVALDGTKGSRRHTGLSPGQKEERRQLFLQIITGEKPLEAYDTFIKSEEQAGGKE